MNGEKSTLLAKRRCPAIWGANLDDWPGLADDSMVNNVTRCLSERDHEGLHDWHMATVRRYVNGEDVVLVDDPRDARWRP